MLSLSYSVEENTCKFHVLRLVCKLANVSELDQVLILYFVIQVMLNIDWGQTHGVPARSQKGNPNPPISPLHISWYPCNLLYLGYALRLPFVLYTIFLHKELNYSSHMTCQCIFGTWEEIGASDEIHVVTQRTNKHLQSSIWEREQTQIAKLQY